MRLAIGSMERAKQNECLLEHDEQNGARNEDGNGEDQKTRPPVQASGWVIRISGAVSANPSIEEVLWRVLEDHDEQRPWLDFI